MQCLAPTQKQTQCTRKALPGSNFCKIHQFHEKDPKTSKSKGDSKESKTHKESKGDGKSVSKKQTSKSESKGDSKSESKKSSKYDPYEQLLRAALKFWRAFADTRLNVTRLQRVCFYQTKPFDERACDVKDQIYEDKLLGKLHMSRVGKLAYEFYDKFTDQFGPLSEKATILLSHLQVPDYVGPQNPFSIQQWIRSWGRGFRKEEIERCKLYPETLEKIAAGTHMADVSESDKNLLQDMLAQPLEMVDALNKARRTTMPAAFDQLRADMADELSDTGIDVYVNLPDVDFD